MDDLQLLLERYYATFIDAPAAKNFFSGLANYLDFANTVPQFQDIAKEISAQRHSVEATLRTTEKLAIRRLQKTKDELVAYIEQHDISDPRITEAVVEYGQWFTDNAIGSLTKPQAMHNRLANIVEVLNEVPDYKEFASRYIELPPNSHYVVARYFVPSQEYKDYEDALEEFKRARNSMLWGQLDQIGLIYNVIRHGRAQRRELKAKYDEATNNVQNFSRALDAHLLLVEWESIEDGTGHKIHFFIVEKYRPWIISLHNHLLSRYALRAQGQQTIPVKQLVLA